VKEDLWTDTGTWNLA